MLESLQILVNESSSITLWLIPCPDSSTHPTPWFALVFLDVFPSKTGERITNLGEWMGFVVGKCRVETLRWWFPTKRDTPNHHQF